MTELADAADLVAYRAGDPDMALAAAEALVRSYCGWHIAPSRTETVTVDGSGAQVQPLPTLHLTALTSVTEDDDQIVDLAQVRWSDAGYLWRRDCHWTRRLRGVEAAIEHGYAEVPADVQSVVLSVAARSVASPDGVVRQQAGTFSVTYSQAAFNVAGGVALLAHERAILDRYRIPPVP